MFAFLCCVIVFHKCYFRDAQSLIKSINEDILNSMCTLNFVNKQNNDQIITIIPL